jgi:dihydroorotate dehydrogenase electron transfer subunit
MIDQDIKIIFNKRVASDTCLMGFRSPGIASESKPGQFVMIRVSDRLDPLLRRPFSICGIGTEDIVYILYRIVGRGTSILAERGEGEIVSVMGPLGNAFEFPKRDKKALLVAGGIGVAPLFFLAQMMETSDMEFMAGFTSSSEIIETDHIHRSPMSISLATDDGTEGYTGKVTDLLDEYMGRHPEDKDSFCLYTCGPLPMLKRVASVANSLDIPCQVSIEAAMACGLGACQGCAVKVSSQNGQARYQHVCKDGPVFSARSVDWNSL